MTAGYRGYILAQILAEETADGRMGRGSSEKKATYLVLVMLAVAETVVITGCAGERC